jgi:alkylation response protein AidB-like acyl-CoA dehydrogenase
MPLGRLLDLPPARLPAGAAALRAEVRAFLAAEMSEGRFTPACDSWLSGHDPAFTRRLAERGWVGMTWPAEYGGHGRSALERFVVVEELLAAGAPVAAHWIADRQSGPGILKHGTEDQKRRFLPAIARGECFFAIGMSEPDAGSDLSSIRTAARRVEGGWRLRGTKVWTSHAHLGHYSVVLARTTPGSERHAGLSQLIVDLHADGVAVNPIRHMSGDAHFTEMVFDDAFVAEGMLLGTEGQGWAQVLGELAFERSGPDRFLSAFPLLPALLDCARADPDDRVAEVVGSAVASMVALRRLSLGVAVALHEGRDPSLQAALVKDLGTRFEGELVEAVRRVAGRAAVAESADRLPALLAGAVVSVPNFTLRGGTSEILRGMVARGLGLR